MKSIFMTHDLSCALGELSGAARRCPLAPEPSGVVTDLAVAAVAFTVQLAIDVAGCDPAEMRVLECELIGKLKAAAVP